mgnify:CR=1 FL=1|tara:strand:- start:738 stop:1133 length:396 start_codon:yes stop_codon:yes gene_type:complete
MANPNIAAAASIHFQNGGWSLNSNSTGTAIILTVASEYALKINSLYVCNTQATDETVTITFGSIGALTGAAHNNDSSATPSLVSGLTIPANTTVQIIDNPIYMVESDTMSAFGGTDDDDLKVFASWEAFID